MKEPMEEKAASGGYKGILVFLVFIVLLGGVLFYILARGTAVAGERASARSPEEVVLSELREAHEVVLSELHSRSVAYSAALMEYQRLGSVDARTLSSEEEIGERIELLQRVQERYAHLMEQFARMPEHFREVLERRNVEPEAIEAAVPQLRKEFEEMYASAEPIQELEMEILQTSQQVLQVLKDEWGNWSAEPETGTILFSAETSDENFERYQAAQQRMIKAAQEQTRLRTETEEKEPDE